MCSTSIIEGLGIAYRKASDRGHDIIGFHHDENTLRAAVQSFRHHPARKAANSDRMQSFTAAVVNHELGAVHWTQSRAEQRQASS